MRRYALKENLISALLGIVVGIPICMCAVHSWTDKAPVERITLPLTESSTQLEVYEMTEEDLAEEEYYDSLELLASIVMAEAESEDLMGKRMVVDVVLNRVDDPDFPDTIYDVLTQPYHFTSYWDGRYAEIDPTEDCYTAVKMELEERSYPGIFYFNSGDYSEYGTPWKVHQNHYFSTK